MSKTVYPVPGVNLPNVEAKEQSVDDVWADELVASGAFRFTDISAADRKALEAQEDKRIKDAEQSNPELNNAKLVERLEKNDDMPPEAQITVPADPASAEERRPLGGGGLRETANADGGKAGEVKPSEMNLSSAKEDKAKEK